MSQDTNLVACRLQSTRETALLCPRYVCAQGDVLMSQTEMVLSPEQLSNRLEKGMKQTEFTLSTCPLKEWRHTPYSTSQILMAWSIEQVARNSPV